MPWLHAISEAQIEFSSIKS